MLSFQSHPRNATSDGKLAWLMLAGLPFLVRAVLFVTVELGHEAHLSLILLAIIGARGYSFIASVAFRRATTSTTDLSGNQRAILISTGGLIVGAYGALTANLPLALALVIDALTSLLIVRYRDSRAVRFALASVLRRGLHG